jgi:concentrative nucleoside transporter, CNT family
MEGLLRVGFGLFGLAVLIGTTWVFSNNKRRVDWRLVGIGLLLQLAVASLVLLTPWGARVFDALSGGFVSLLGFTTEGARFIFGDFSDPSKFGFVFAFQVLPTIIFFASLMTLLYYIGIMQLVVKGIAWLMQKTLRTSGAETLSASGNIFLGQTEAPLLIKPFVRAMTRSELLTVMVGGFATVAGGVMAAYIGMLRGTFPDIAGHLLAASVMNAPAGLMLSKIILPETAVPVTKGTLRMELEKTDSNVIEAAANGAGLGVQLAINVGAMLMAFVALVALINYGFGWLGGLFGMPELSLQFILGQILRPLAWVMGVPWQDTAYVGGLIGLKATLNEFIAYAQFGADLGQGIELQPRTAIILTYALLGFANFSSIAIQIGGIGGLAPERRSEIALFGLRAMIAGNLAAFMSASIAGMLV